tara:strand:- start:592 stop:1002 length:411 start_codon:yes stop_codon:yes gene_type:complete
MKMMKCNHAGASSRCDACKRSVPHACDDGEALCTPGHMEVEVVCRPVAEPVDPPPCPECERLREQHSKAVNAATIAVLEIEKQARKKTEAAYADAHRALAEVEDVLREALRHVEGTRQDTWDTLRSATKGGERGQD